MRKMKKFAALAMVATLAAATFAGCGKKSDNSNSGSDVWNIGSIGPITGDAAVYGRPSRLYSSAALRNVHENNFQKETAGRTGNGRGMMQHQSAVFL